MSSPEPLVSHVSGLQPFLQVRWISLHPAVTHMHFPELCLAREFRSPCDGDLLPLVPGIPHFLCHLQFIIRKDPALNH